LEHPHRSALENHVHRTPRLGNHGLLNVRIGINLEAGRQIRRIGQKPEVSWQAWHFCLTRPDVFARAAAPQHMIFVPRVTDIPAQDTNFVGTTCRRNLMNTTFHSYRAPAWSGLKRYFVE
jgi:hypothetical protein